LSNNIKKQTKKKKKKGKLLGKSEDCFEKDLLALFLQKSMLKNQKMKKGVLNSLFL
jgi:hypothetical protein